MGVSVCISAFNRPEYCINAVLQALVDQARLPDEVVLVDDGSNISTAKDAYNKFKDNLNINYIWNNNPGNTANTLGNNIAIKNATQDLVIVISADIILHPQAIKNLAWFDWPPASIIGYPVYSLTVAGTKKFLSLGASKFSTAFSEGLLSIRSPNLIITEEARLGPEDILSCYQGPPDKQVNYFACAFMKQPFIDIGGFNEDYSVLGGWEDQDFKARTSMIFKPIWDIYCPSFHLGHWHDTPEYFRPKQDPDWGKPALRANKEIPIWTHPYANQGKEWGIIRK